MTTHPARLVLAGLLLLMTAGEALAQTTRPATAPASDGLYVAVGYGGAA